MKHVKRLAAVAAFFLWAANGHSFTAVYAFGDSLTDTGRNPSSGTNYYNGRYSNGPLWVEYLSALLGITYNASNNFAVSGSETSDLQSEIAGLPASTNLMQNSSRLRVYYMDANTEFLTLYDSPATYGFMVISIGALQDTNLTNKSFNGPGADYMFWDPIHPTTKTHSFFGQLAYRTVAAGLGLTGIGTNLSLTVSNLYPGFQYAIQGSTNLTAWTNYQSFTATNTNTTVTLTNTAKRVFYRVGY